MQNKECQSKTHRSIVCFVTYLLLSRVAKWSHHLHSLSIPSNRSRGNSEQSKILPSETTTIFLAHFHKHSKMDQHRKCEACNRSRSVAPPPTRLYLKRRSKSSIAISRSRRTPEPVYIVTSYAGTFMADARPSNANDPDPFLAAQVDATTVPTSDDADVDQHVEAARIRMSRLLEQARKPLIAPCVTPTELTTEESVEKANALAWVGQYEMREQTIEEMGKKNDRLFEEVLASIDAVAAESPAMAPIAQDSSGGARLKPEERLEEVGGSQCEVSITSAGPTEPEPVCEMPIAPLPLRSRVQAVSGPNSPKSSAKSNMGSSNSGWHTLWSFDYNASW